jgi:hypothetical protein
MKPKFTYMQWNMYKHFRTFKREKKSCESQNMWVLYLLLVKVHYLGALSREFCVGLAEWWENKWKNILAYKLKKIKRISEADLTQI